MPPGPGGRGWRLGSFGAGAWLAAFWEKDEWSVHAVTLRSKIDRMAVTVRSSMGFSVVETDMREMRSKPHARAVEAMPGQIG